MWAVDMGGCLLQRAPANESHYQESAASSFWIMQSMAL